jgi:hypothetical protein
MPHRFWESYVWLNPLARTFHYPNGQGIDVESLLPDLGGSVVAMQFDVFALTG